MKAINLGWIILTSAALFGCRAPIERLHVDCLSDGPICYDYATDHWRFMVVDPVLILSAKPQDEVWQDVKDLPPGLRNQVILPEGDGSTSAYLLDLKNLQAGGYQSVRLYVDLWTYEESMPFNSRSSTNTDGSIDIEPIFEPTSMVTIQCYHRFFAPPSTSSSLYFSKSLSPDGTNKSCSISGWMDIPLIGPQFDLIIVGEDLPRKNMMLKTTMYLTK